MLKENFHEAYTNDLPTVTTGGAAIVANIEKRQKAWGYLTLVLEKTPANLIQGVANQNPYTAWNILTNWYKPSDTDATNCLCQDFETTILQDPTDDPES